MLDNFREWLSDNLRYILLGLAVLVVLVVLILGVKVLSGAIGKAENANEKQNSEQKNSSDDEKDTDDSSTQAQESNSEDTSVLQKNAYPEISAIINTFYTAWSKKDIESMKSVTDSFDATDEAKVQNSTYIESYNNINTYTKKGITEGSYVVFVSYDLKFVDINTPAPGLTQVYVMTDDNGKVYIHTDDNDKSIQDYINTVTQDKDVQELITSVQTQYQAAQDSDEKLRKFEEELGSVANSATQAADGTMIKAKNQCNVRAEASSESQKIGSLAAGQQVKKVGNADSGWVKIEFDGQTGFVRGDLLQ